MNIVEFLTQSAGRWSSMRTNHYFSDRQQEGGKSTLEIELLDATDPVIVQTCERYGVDPSTVACAVKTNWDGMMESEQGGKPGSTVLVAIANAENPREGQLLKQIGAGEKASSGRYRLNDEDELRMILESETMYAEERLWFESENVRLRHSTLKRPDGFSLASFCSEIRLGVVKPPADSAAAKAQA
jgi:hypothetical protein